jgi:all-trans-retinol dehydrogenase (NAD+)
VGAQIRKAHGDPTVLINNAAVGYAMTILDEPMDSIRRSFEVNTVSHFLTVKEFLPAMIKKNHGHVVTIASMASYVTVASIVDYNCTKASAVAFHEGLASELKHRYDAPNVRTS